MLDLKKAFECVRLDVVWVAALKTGFPMAVLRLALRAYCHARRLIYKGIVGDPILSTNAILAGGGLATDMLALLLTNALALLRRELPKVHLFIVVDDLTIRVEGSTAAVASELVHLTSVCIEQLESELCMKVSRGDKWSTPDHVKSVAVASSKEARASLVTGMRALGILVSHHTRNLGVDFAPGRKTQRRAVLHSRWRKVRAKVKRCRKVGSQAAGVVGRTALLPAVAYGTSCTGTPQGLLADMRSAMAQMHGPMHGRSKTARLAIHRGDPIYLVVLAPLCAWWRAVGEGPPPSHLMQAALAGATKSAEASGHLVHSVVEGGVGAYLFALASLKWKADGISRVVLNNGTCFELGLDGDPKVGGWRGGSLRWSLVQH